MCDYSLHNFASRPARLGEELVTTSFGWTRGFASITEPNVAVCVQSGTELAFAEEVYWERLFVLFRRKPAVGMLARFWQVDTGIANAHHDAIEFPDGRIVLLTLVFAGQRATIMQLPVERPPVGPLMSNLLPASARRSSYAATLPTSARV
jgi:hypothetical protein